MGNKGATAWEEYKKNSSGYGGYTSSTKAKGGASAWKEFRDSGALESAFSDRRNFISGAYSRVFNYGRKASSYYNSAQKDWNGLSWGNAAELASKNASAVDPLKTEGNDILAWLEENRDALGYNYNALKRQVLDINSGYDDILSDFNGVADFYGQFDTEEDYLKWDAYSTTEKRQATYQQNLERLDELTKHRDELKPSEDQPGNPYTTGGGPARTGMPYGAGNLYLNPVAEPGPAKTRDSSAADTPYGAMLQYREEEQKTPEQLKLEEIEREIARLQTETTMYRRGTTDDQGNFYGSMVVDDYSKYLENPNYGKYSASDFSNPTREDLDYYDAMMERETWYEDESGVLRNRDGAEITEELGANDPRYQVEDELGLFLSLSKDERDAIVDTTYGYHTYDDVFNRGTYGNWEMLTADEVGIYYTLLGTEGKAAAMKYLSDMSVELDRRKMYEYDEKIKRAFDEASSGDRVLMSALSVPANLFGGALSFVDDMGHTIKGEEINPYSDMHYAQDYAQKVRQYQAAAFDEAYKWEIPWIEFSSGDLYQAVMSTADMAGGAVLGPTTYGALMGMGAATSEARRLYEMGASSEQIALGAGLAGAAEMVFERYSMDKLIHLKDADKLRKVITNALIQGGIEASEEGATEIANLLTNNIIMTSESDWAKLLEEHNGSEYQAFIAAAGRVGSASMAGFVAGFLGGGGGSIASYTNNYYNDAKTGQAINDAEGMEKLREIANDQAKKRSELAQKDRTTKQEQRDLNRWSENANKKHKWFDELRRNRATGMLYKAVQQSVDSDNVADIASALREQGISEKKAKAIAQAFYAQATEQGTTKQQALLIREYGENPVVQKVIADTLFDTESPIYQRNRALREFEFDVMTNQIRQGSLESTEQTGEAGENTAEAVDDLDTTYEFSDDGKAHLKSAPDQAVDIVGFESINNGKVRLRTSDGNVVDASDVLYASEADAIIFETIASMNVSEKSANILLKGFRGKEGIEAEAYAKAIQEAFEYGRLGIPESELNLSSALDSSQRDYVYRQGRKAAGKQVAKEQSTIGKKEKTSNGEKRTGTVHFDRKGRTFDAVRETSLKTLEQLAAGLGIDIYVYESYENESGDRVYLDDHGNEVEAPNGFYDPSDGSIHIDLNAGQDGKGIILFTASHELVHFIRQWSPAKFKVLANFLVEQYHKKGASVSDLIQQQKDKAKQDGRQITTEEAFEEMVADSMETMLTDGNVVQMMAELKQRDRTLWQKICDWFRDLVADLQQMVDAYKDVKPETAEGRMVADMKDSIAVFQALYTDALQDASESFQTVKNTTGEGGVAGDYEIKLSDREETKFKQFAKEIDSVVNLSISGKGNIDGKAQIKDIMPTGPKITAMVATSSGNMIDISERNIALSTSDIWHEFKRHTSVDAEISRGQIAFTKRQFQNAVKCIISPDIVETIFFDANNPTQKQSFAYAKKTSRGNYVVVEAVGGKKNPHIYPVMILQFSRAKWNNMISQGKTLGEILFENDPKKLQALDIKRNKESRVTAAQFASYEAIANTLRSPQLTSTVAQADPAVNKKFSDRDYMDAVNQGDMRTAQKMVDAAAKTAGFPIKAYHGTPIKGITIFDSSKIGSTTDDGIFGSGFYFTTNKLTADGYATVDGETMPVFLHVEKPWWGLGHKLPEVAKQLDLDENMLTVRKVGKSASVVAPLIRYARTFTTHLVDNGYDSVIVQHGKHDYEVVVFDNTKVKSADPVTYDDKGNVIPLSKRFDSSNPDIRYSSRNKASKDINAALQKENTQLKEDVQQLKELLKLQRTVTGGTKFTRSSVESMAKVLMKSNNARGRQTELADLLNGVYEYIATEKDLTWEDVAEKAQPAVEWIRKHTVVKKELSQYAKDILHDVRTSRISLSETQKDEAAYRFGSVNDYRKSMMGSVVIANDGVPLDIQWQEWSTTYPDIFDAEITAADMPGALADVIASLRNSDLSMTEYAYHADMIEQDLLRQVYDGFWRVSTLRTVADVKQREINELKSKHYQKMNDLRQKHQEASEKMKEAQRERIKKLRQEYRDSADKRIQEIKDRHKATKAKLTETRAKREATTKLRDLVLDTARWIERPKKTEIKVPDVLKKPYMEFLNGIDLSSRRLESGGNPTVNDLRLATAMGSLATAIDRITAGQDPSSTEISALDYGYLDLPADFVQRLQNMAETVKTMMDPGDYAINSMTAKEVRELSKMIRTLNHAIREIGNLYANTRFANAQDLGKESMGFMDDLGEVEHTRGSSDFIIWDNALPFYAFKRFGLGGETVFEGLMDGQDKLAFLSKDIFDFQEKTWTGEEARKWSEDTHTIQLPSGNSLTLTTADAMSIYCLSRRGQGLQHLLGGGVRVIGIQKGSKKAKDSRANLTMEDIDAIVDSLDSRQKKVAEDMQEFMSTTCAEWGNEISMKRFLTREFTEEHYFPIESNRENMTTQDPTAQQSDLFRLLNISATKALTPNANNEVIIRNVFDVFTGHASDMARLNAFAMPLLDYMKWLNYRERTVSDSGQVDVKGVRKSMEKAYGAAAQRYVMNLIKDVNGRSSDAGDPTALMKWMRAAKTAAVGNSLRVATLQVTSYPRAAMVIAPKNLALGLSKKPNIKDAKKYCGIALWKSFGFYDTNISRSIEDQMKGIVNPKQKMIEWSLKGAEIGDALTWGYLWNACEYEVAATRQYQVGSEEFKNAVGKKLREVIYRTQVVDSTLTRSDIMRKKSGAAQEAAAFMSEPTLSANILMDAGFAFNLERRRTGSAKAAWGKTGAYIMGAIAVYSIGQLTAALVEALWDAWRDDDDEEFGEKYLAAFRENLILDILPFNKVPIVSDIFEAVLSMAGIGFYSSDRMTTTWITNAVSAVDAWKDYLGGESNVTAYGAIFKSVKALSSFYGVAGSGLMREAVALWNNTAGAYDSTLKIRQRTLSKSQLGGEYLDAVISGNDRQAENIAGQFATDEEREKAIRAAIKNRFTSGEIGELDAAKYLILYGGLDASDAHWNIEKWVFDMSNESGEDYHKYDEFLDAVKSGENLDAVIEEYLQNGVSRTDLRKQISSGIRPEYIDSTAEERKKMRENLLAAMQACGMSESDAENTIGEWEFEAEYGFDYSDRKTAYLSGEVDEDLLKKALVEYGGYDSKDAELQIQVYEWNGEGYDDVTLSAVRDYNENCAALNVPKDTYLYIRKFANNTQNDVVNGKEVDWSAVKKIMREINAQQGLTPAQKTALARSIPRNWKDSTIQKYKLW